MMRLLVSGGRLLINETICDTLNLAQEAHLEYHALKADIDTAKGGYHRHNYTRTELFALLQEAHIEAEKIFISDNEPPILSSKEKVWQFTHKIDEMVELAGELPQKNSFESRSWALKEKIKTHGFQKPPQLALIAYKP
jgi:hypothetical protein